MESRALIKEYKRIVVKIGTSSLHYQNGKLNLQTIDRLAWTLSDLRNQDKEIILVSSGAIAVGAQRLGLAERPRDVMGKQAASAVGQAVLMQIYENFFTQYTQKVAQILLTKDVLDDVTRKTNAGNTFRTLFSMGVIPIVNENDSISTEELGFSENDSLSAYVARLVEGDLLIILSDIDGLRESDPKINPDAKMISEVNEITGELFGMAGDVGSSLGTGGMQAKLAAAQIATEAGIDTVIASGGNPGVLFSILNGDNVGTLFRASKKA